jgi:actin-related protein
VQKTTQTCNIMEGEDVQALVIDNGSGMCKAGFAGDGEYCFYIFLPLKSALQLSNAKRKHKTIKLK